MADAKKLLRALLAKAYKKQETEIDQILADTMDDDAAEAQLTNWDANRVAEIKKPVPGTTFQDGYKKAKAEVLTDLEKTIVTKYGVELDPDNPLKAEDLVDHVIATKSKTGGANLTEDQVRAHPTFQKAEQDFKKTLKAKETEFTQKLAEVQTTHQKETTFSAVSKKILDNLNAMNPVLPAKPEVAQTWTNNFVNSFKEFDFEIQDGRVVVMKEGKVLQDQHGHTLEFDDLIKTRAPQYFEFKANNGGANGGNGKPGEEAGAGADNKGYPAGIQKPKTFEELSKIVNDQTIKNEDRQIVLQTWETEQAAGSR